MGVFDGSAAEARQLAFSLRPDFGGDDYNLLTKCVALLNATTKPLRADDCAGTATRTRTRCASCSWASPSRPTSTARPTSAPSSRV